MEISQEELQSFKRMYKEEFGKELSDQEAYEKALKLITLIKAVYLPDD